MFAGTVFVEHFDDVDHAGVHAGDQAQYAERYDHDVLPQAPVAPAQSRVLPVGHQIDAARQDQAQERQAQRADQRYDRTEAGHGDGDGDWRNTRRISVTPVSVLGGHKRNSPVHTTNNTLSKYSNITGRDVNRCLVPFQMISKGT